MTPIVVTSGSQINQYTQQNIWKIYWRRGNLKWSSNEPKPTVNLLNDFFKIVDEVEYVCFKG
jgi:hypothetical protein